MTVASILQGTPTASRPVLYRIANSSETRRDETGYTLLHQPMTYMEVRVQLVQLVHHHEGRNLVQERLSKGSKKPKQMADPKFLKRR